MLTSSKKVTDNSVKMIIAVVTLFTILCFAATAQAQVTKKFQVEGRSDGVGWSWGIVVGGGLECKDTQLGPVDPNNEVPDATEFVAAFVASINAAGAPCGISAAVDPDNPSCFTVTHQEGNFQFWVGDAAGTPTSGCQVTNNPGGCNFNPNIREGLCEFPTLSQWVLIILALSVAAFFVWQLKRRRKAVASV